MSRFKGRKTYVAATGADQARKALRAPTVARYDLAAYIVTSSGIIAACYALGLAL